MYLITSGIRQGSGSGPGIFIGGTYFIATGIKNCKKKFFVDKEDFHLEGSVEILLNIISEINDTLS